MTKTDLYVSRKEGRVTSSIEDRVGESIGRSEHYIKKSKERLITAASNSTDNLRINKTTKFWKQKWGEKQLHGYFM